jgi:hypothetical protein
MCPTNTQSKFAHSPIAAFDNHTHNLRPPSTPTLAIPGSAEKLAVLCARAAAGEALFHESDVMIDMPMKAARAFRMAR